MRSTVRVFVLVLACTLVACRPSEAEIAAAKADATADSLATAAVMERNYVVDPANSTIQWSGTMVSV